MNRALTLIFLLVSLSIYAQEGTKQLMPNSNDRLWLEFNTFAGNNFGNYSANEKERIHIYLKAGETMHFGMNMNKVQYSGDVFTNTSRVWFRIKDPNGTVIYPETTMRTSGNGYISSYTEAITGPNGVVLNGTTISGGYDALTYTAATTGNHYIEFRSRNDNRFALQFFDVTVTDASNNVVTNPGEPNISAGRLWSKGWLFTNTSFDNYPVKADFYVFTSDEFINKVSYEMKPYSFSFVANSYGVNSSTALNYIQKAQSQEDDQTSNSAEYRVYLNDPDRVVWPNTTLSPPKVQVWAEDTLLYDYDYYRDPMLDTIDDTFIELLKNKPLCPYEDVTIFKIEASVDGFVAILIDIDGGGYSTAGNDRVIYRSMKKGLNYILWDFKDENGDTVSNQDYTASATFLGRGPAHFPLYDVESLSRLSTSSVRPFKKLELTNYWDDSQITTWGDALGAMDETQQTQLEINADIPRVWTFDSGDSGGNHNGNMNTLNSWFHAIDLGLQQMTLRVEQSDTKCIDGTAPYVGDIYKYGDKNTTMNFSDTEFSEKFFDPTDQAMVSIQVLSLPDPSDGILYLSGNPVAVNEIISSANTNFLTFEPTADWYGKAKFAWHANNGTKWSNNQDTVYLIINTDPTISSISDQTICTNSSLLNMPFTVDDEESTTDLNIVAYSHNTALVPNSNISISGTGTNRSLTVTPKTNTSGFAIIYVKVDDGLSEAIEEFSLYVGPDLEFSGDTTVCVGDDLNLIAQEIGATYEWKIDATTLGTSRTLTIPAASVQAGNYSLTVSKDGCSSTRYFEVAIAPLTTFSGDVDVCIGEEISLSATETVATYIWRQGTNIVGSSKVLTIPDAQLSNAAADYTLEVTKEGCNNTSPQFEITVIAEANKDIAVTGNTIDIGSDGTVTIVNAENGVVYEAYIGTTFITSETGTGANLNLTIPAANLNIGDNVITLTAANANCEVSLNNTATIHVNVVPIAINDIETVNEDASVNTNVLNNDTGLDDGGIVVTITGNATNGTAVVQPDNSVTYTPNADYNGTDSYTYQIEDVDGDTDNAVVTITVNAVDDVVSATNDSFSVNEDNILNDDVLLNDINLGDGGIETNIVSNVSNGTLILNIDGTFTYTPNADFNGTDSFTYQLSDMDGDTDDATVNIIVNSVNDLVNAVADGYTISEDGSLSDDVLINDLGLGDGGISVSLVSGVSNGSLTLNATGTFSYTPNANFFGSDQFTYELRDINNDTDNAIVTITINSVDDIVVAVDDTYNVDEDGSLSDDVLSNDTGLGDGGIVVSIDTDVSNGSLTLNPDGTFLYAPSADFNGQDSFTYQIIDSDGDNDIATVTIDVNSIDDVVDAVNDGFTVLEDGSLSDDVIANDLNLGDGGLLVSLVSGVSDGLLSLNANGTFTYTPNADFYGSDSFTYRLRDADGDTDDAIVSITITSVNDVIDAVNDAFSVNEDDVLNENVITNDLYLGDGGISVGLVLNVSDGILNLNTDGTFEYSPNQDFNGTDQFTYSLTDGDGDTDNAVVTITINSVNDTPVANNDAVSTSQDTDVDITVLGNDTGLGDGVNTLNVTSAPANGSTLVNGDNTITYSPNPGFNGTNNFTYEVCDNDAQCSSATVTITVDNQDDQPVANNDIETVDEDDFVITDVLANDQDLFDGGLVVTITSLPTNGVASVNPDNTVTYTPNTNYFGADTYTYQVCDGDGDCATADVDITVNSVDDIVEAIDDVFSVAEDGVLNGNVIINDLNLGDGGIATTVVANVSNGTLVLNLDGTFTYTPNADYNGPDSFTYELRDSDNDVNNAIVNITVSSVNDVVNAVNDSFSVAEDGILNDDVITNDQNLGDDGLSTTVVSNVSNGVLVLNPDGSFTYTPNADFNGTDQFTYQLQDADLDTDNATVTITVTSVNDVVDAIDDAYSIAEDGNLNDNVISNDLNLGDGGIVTTVVTNVSNGSLTLNPDGTFTYTPNADYNGSDSFTYELRDTDNDVNNATVTITVTSVNDVVDAIDDTYTINEDNILNDNVIANDLNLGDGGITTTIVGNVSNGIVVLNSDGSFTYTPNADFNGSDNFTYELKDVDGDTNNATVTITINPVDDIVDAVNDVFSVVEDGLLNDNVITNDLNLGDGGITTTVVNNVDFGTLALNPNGTFTYTPNADYNGPDEFTYQLRDADNDVNTATVSITITPVNDAVDAVNDGFSVNEDESLSNNVITNDQNLGDGGIETVVTSTVSNGTLILNLDGSFTYSPNPDYNGADSFDYELIDLDGDADIATVSITINPIDDIVDAIDDSYSVNEDATLVDDVSTNDLNLGDAGINVTLNSGVSNGTLNLNADGTFDYSPNADYNGPDSFTYEICDTDGDCEIATVSINVFPVNDVVDAVNDTYSVNEDVILNENVISNDLNLGDGGLVVSLITDVNNGTLVLNADGTFVYTPNADYNGPDEFTYQLRDVNNDVNTAIVSITVIPVNDVVDAVNDSYFVDEDNNLSDNVQTNDLDLGDGNISISLITNVINGTLVLNSNGSFTYTPNSEYNGGDSFVYEIEDADGDTDQATVTITVNSVNDIPIAINDNTGTQQNTPTEIIVLANDQNLGDGVNTVSIDTYPTAAMGTVAVNLTNTITYTPAVGYTGTATFKYEVCDNDGECSIADVTIIVDNIDDQPTTVDDSDVTDEDIPVTVDVLTNDGGLFDGGIVVTIDTNPGNGTAIVNPDNKITYTPNPDWYGADNIIYQVCDGDGDCDLGTLAITVNPVNDYVPVAVDDSRATIINNPVTVDVLINDTDLDDGGLNVYIETPPTSGSTSIVGNEIIFTPALDFSGIITFEYRICDLDTDCDVGLVTIEVNATNYIPVANDDNATTLVNTNLNINVLANDVDLNDGVDSVSVYINPVNGAAIVNVDNTITYSPGIDFIGVDSLTYMVEDLNGDYDLAKVYITVNPKPNYLPDAVDDSRATTINSPVTIDVLANDLELLDGGIVVTLDSAPNPLEGTAIVNGDMTITFTPAVDYNGITNFTYQVCDKDSDCDIATVSVNVKENNSVPVANDDNVSTIINEAVIIHVLDNDNGLDDGIKNLTIQVSPSNGDVTVNPDNTITYIPYNWYKGTDQFEYLIEDMDGDKDVAVVNITITEKVNSVPLAIDDTRATSVNTNVNIDVLLNDSGLDDGGIVVTIKSAPNPAEGSASVNVADNTIDFTPVLDFIGSTIFEYLVCDADGDCDSAYVIVNTKEVNFIPVAVDDYISTEMNKDVNVNVVSNDNGFEDGLGEVIIITDPVHGNAVVLGDNTITYTPASWFVGSDSLEYLVKDLDGDPAKAKLYIEVTPLVNNIPVANDDYRGTSVNTDVIVDVLFNDTGLEDGGIVVSKISDPTNGSIVVNPDNTITYTPNLDYLGSDQFEYQVCDIDGDCSATAQVNINVKIVNIVPVAIDDNAETYMDTPVTINVLANDTKLFDGVGEVRISANPLNGSVIVNSDKTITYTPFNWYIGTDHFDYVVEDIDGDCSVATVTVSVIEIPNFEPIANDDSRGTDFNTEVIVNVLINDTGLEDGGIVVSKISDPTNGSIVVNSDNTITYTPNNGYFGTDQFDYQVCDADNDCSSATVTINVKETINNNPIAVNDDVTVYMNIQKIIHVLSNDSGLEDGIKSVEIYTNPVNGSVIVNPDYSVSYTPSSWYTGSDSFEYVVKDVDGDYGIATVNVTIIEEPNYIPVAVDDSRATSKNTSLNINVLINDTGLEDGGLAMIIDSTPTNGTAVIETDNTITYTPNADYLGIDQFNYQVCDIDGECSIATVIINVKEVNNIPVAVDDNASTFVNNDVTKNVIANDSGLEDGGINVTINSNPNHGTLIVNANNSITYSPYAWYVGTDEFEYIVKDVDGDLDVAKVYITINSKPDYIPVAVDDSRATSLNNPVNVDVLINDTGLEDGGIIVTINSAASNGNVVVESDNTITYTPNTDYIGIDQFEYQVCDADGDCATAVVEINVKQSNKVPIAVDDSFVTYMDMPISMNLLSNDTNLDDGGIQVSVYSDVTNGILTVNTDNTVIYIPLNWYVGSDSFEYMVSDEDGDYDIATVSITIDPRPDFIPVANDDSRGVSKNIPVIIDVLINDTGLEDGGIIVTENSSPANGSTVVNVDNTITYTPNSDYIGTDQFDYQVCDADGDCDIATVILNVKESNATPVAIDDNTTTVMDTEVDINVLANDTGLEDGGIFVTAYNNPVNGTIVVNDNYTITYTPFDWFVGSDSFEYIVSDVDGDYDIATVHVTVEARPNYIPIANNDAQGTSINTEVDVNVLANDLDLNDGGIIVSIYSDPSNGTISVNANNTIKYTPNNNYLGTDQFTYQVCDKDGDCDIASVEITVRNENHIPVAIDDKYFTGVNTAKLIDVLSNDSGLEDGGISIEVISNVIVGNVDINSDLTINYTPLTGYEGIDQFEYKVIDADGDYDIAMVTIEIMSGALPGVTITEVSGNTSEDGTVASFTVVLDTQPTADVSIDLNSNDITEGIVSESKLTFTSSNWDQSQSIDITGVDDYVDDGDVDYKIIFENVVSTDTYYNNLSLSNLDITNIDDDEAGISVSPITSNTSEDGDTASFSISLDSEPLENVIIELKSTDESEGTLEIIEIIFTPNDWNDTTIVVAGVDDSEVDGDIDYGIIIMESESLDPKYDAIDKDDITITNTDNDSKELIIPDAFSPGGDGFNDFFEIVNLEHHERASLKVYNRWGSLVYSSNNYKSDWDGKSNIGTTIGSDLPTGTYYYVLEIQGKGEKISGYVFIKR